MDESLDMEAMVFLISMIDSYLFHSIRKGARVIKIKENPFSYDTYLSLENGNREWLVDMGWTNGTQLICNGSCLVSFKIMICKWEQKSERK